MLSVTVCALSALATSVALPADRTITWDIRETPSDPTSDVVFSVSALISADSESGSDVKWDVLKIEFVQPLSGGGDNLWRIDNPVLDTSDGFWTVTHANTKSPTVDEFREPPSMSDTATAITTGLADLDYDITSYAPPVGPYPVTSKLSYEFIRVGETTPEEEGDEEPVETFEDDPPI